MSNEKWHVVEYKDGLYVADKTNHCVCTITNTMVTPKDKADAALIAAAPEMLNEAKRYLPILKDLQECHPTLWAILTQGTGIATINGLQHAINKAETI